jgi:uncharacterized protein (TIGR02646 family)
VIKLKRARDAQALHQDFTGEGLFRKLVALAQARIDHGDDIEWEGVLGDWKKMKPALKQNSFDKCAYCEARTSEVAHGDVEHFRPKSVYWWLALCVDNYVFSCQLCNQTHKKDHFPIHGTQLKAPRLNASLPTTDKALRRLAKRMSPDPSGVDEAALLTEWLTEDPDLPHPYLEDPEPMFAWAPVETNEEVYVVVPDNATPRAKRAVQAAVDYLGLNRETLVRSRYFIYSSLTSAVGAWKRGDVPSLNQIQRMCQAKHPFSGMCRYFAHLAGAPVIR